MTSTITFCPAAAASYSQTIPVAPAGSCVVPPPAIPTALGSAAVPSADATVLPDGHEDDAVVVVGSATVGAGVAVGVGAAAVGVEAGLELVLGVELPHAAKTVAANPTAASESQLELLRVTRNASSIRSLV